MMQKSTLICAIAAGFTLMAPALYAADDTTTNAATPATPEAATKIIELPDKASEQTKESAASGLATDNAARPKHDDNSAAEAREARREHGKRMAEEARANNRSEQRRAAADARREAAL